MWRKCAVVALLVAAISTVTGCAVAHSPAYGLVTATQGPVGVGDVSAQTTKEGRAVCQSLLGIAAWGDCTVKAAADNGKITKIHSVDQKSLNVLFIFAKYETIVRGE